MERCHAIREGFFNEPSQDLGAERRALVNFFGKFFCCDASAGERVISVRYGINETFKPSELGVFGNCLKCAIGS